MTAQKSLKDFGYGFDKGGCLRQLENGVPGEKVFHFNVSSSHQECQKHYEELGDAITEHVYEILQKDLKLMKLPVPKESDDGTFIFVSKDYDTKDMLLILIHGSGVVRAGQWARSLIINDNLEKGSQIQYIKKANELDYGILIMNTNDNFKTVNGKCQNIKYSATPEEHAIYVWENYVLPSKATNIAVVAHSYGGIITLELANKFKNDFEGRVVAVAFTDSVHSYVKGELPKKLLQISKNWVSSEHTIDQIISTPANDIQRVSAGHPKHEMTSYSAIDSVFKFIQEKISK